MGLQLIVKADYKKIEKVLGDLMSECEVFPVAEDLLGLSISEHTLSSQGEDAIRRKLERLKRFDLWQGSWQSARRRWLS
ncbi:TPA: hypothetical protein ACQ29W_005110 [Klebsiella pneumoniae]|jgi:hypothetical protein|uniref:hypothetical protein n=1 Tax=Klebsiella TaxID=570 RepID=UPI000CEB88A2|nr:hypothetical protein [Klebsiella pneumoniae]ROD51605.1 hypothetical protein C4Z12_003670 [Klebsiella pneumoniae subsp. pneumoniae]HDT3050314.1 hypothetical protein [Klebsiella pneumoniae subsp. ozaenae]ELC0851865.1 hypothetical protein [Klebsiella pneumoniae]MBL9971298.1 hypothetical protein [Klebsiella pneumoniae]MCD9802601.1 hypothetical protein [Klebsiella pneumoniae]